MTRHIPALLCLLGALLVPAAAPSPAQACGAIHVPVDLKAEIAAIEKALPGATLTDAEREKVIQTLATARKGQKARLTADFQKALADSMKMLGLERIFAKQSCRSFSVPVVTS